MWGWRQIIGVWRWQELQGLLPCGCLVRGSEISSHAGAGQQNPWLRIIPPHRGKSLQVVGTELTQEDTWVGQRGFWCQESKCTEIRKKPVMIKGKIITQTWDTKPFLLLCPPTVIITSQPLGRSASTRSSFPATRHPDRCPLLPGDVFLLFNSVPGLMGHGTHWPVTLASLLMSGTHGDQYPTNLIFLSRFDQIHKTSNSIPIK